MNRPLNKRQRDGTKSTGITWNPGSLNLALVQQHVECVFGNDNFLGGQRKILGYILFLHRNSVANQLSVLELNLISRFSNDSSLVRDRIPAILRPVVLNNILIGVIVGIGTGLRNHNAFPPFKIGVKVTGGNFPTGIISKKQQRSTKNPEDDNRILILL